jgi:phosphoenolpyruvate-protein phosphotransferase (PTS system enzyme I)
MADLRQQQDEVRLQGVSICPGVGMGRVHGVDLDLQIPQEDIDDAQVAAEQDRYARAVQTAQQHLPEHIKSVHGELSQEARAIFQVHEAILSDASFHTRVQNRIGAERKRAEFCLDEEAAELVAAFKAMRDPYFKARSEDIRDMACNLLGILAHRERNAHRPIARGDALVSRHLHSSSVIMAQRSGAAGFASESRALSSHAAILLKGFGIPSVGAVSGLLDAARDGDRIIIDGTRSLVIVRPSPQTEEEYRQKKRQATTSVSSLQMAPCRTADGMAVCLMANVENPDQIPLVSAHGLEGIGLFRTEFLIPPDGRVPSEDEQCEVYRRVFSNAAGSLVTLRTFDIGADKQWGAARSCSGANPALGVRGIRRHLMDEAAELRAQFRAFLRAAGQRPIRILLPMVTTVADVQQAKRMLDEVRDGLQTQGHELPPRVHLGAMIEVPAAAFSLQEILQEVDFVSLGTNDLLQYFTAADRDNERVVQYNEPTNPAFLKLLEQVMQQATAHNRAADVAVCGEIASDPRMVPHLLQRGYRCLSIAPVAAQVVREVIGKTFAEQPAGP